MSGTLPSCWQGTYTSSRSVLGAPPCSLLDRDDLRPPRSYAHKRTVPPSTIPNTSGLTRPEVVQLRDEEFSRRRGPLFWDSTPKTRSRAPPRPLGGSSKVGTHGISSILRNHWFSKLFSLNGSLGRVVLRGQRKTRERARGRYFLVLPPPRSSSVSFPLRYPRTRRAPVSAYATGWPCPCPPLPHPIHPLPHLTHATPR